MADRVTKEIRSAIMASVGSKNTGPEVFVRKWLHALGYRYRLHVRSLPGSPDIVFPSRKKIILVHGCFWHGHDCKKGRLPTSRQDFWEPKIARNRERDAENAEKLKKLGWDVLVVWQCELRDWDVAKPKILGFLENEEQ